MSKCMDTINKCLKENETYIKWIEEEEEALKELEIEWEEMTKEYYEALKSTTDHKEIERVQDMYIKREMSNEKAQLHRIYTIHRIKACMIKENIMEN